MLPSWLHASPELDTVGTVTEGHESSALGELTFGKETDSSLQRPGEAQAQQSRQPPQAGSFLFYHSSTGARETSSHQIRRHLHEIITV